MLTMGKSFCVQGMSRMTCWCLLKPPKSGPLEENSPEALTADILLEAVPVQGGEWLTPCTLDGIQAFSRCLTKCPDEMLWFLMFYFSVLD